MPFLVLSSFHIASFITTGNKARVAALSTMAMKAAAAPTPSATSRSFPDSLRGCIFGLFVGDSLAMPVHWYYNLAQLRRDFGVIRKYEAPKYPFPGSIMNLSNTGGGGRGSDKGHIIGDVINHGKRKYWRKGGQYHYHHGLKPGENTLDAQVARLLTLSLVEHKRFDADAFVAAYAKFMTTPASHKDVYASTAHRMFFANYARQKPLRECPDNDGHNVDAIDALVNIAPLVASMVGAAESSEQIASAAWQLVCCLRRPSKTIEKIVHNYVGLLCEALTHRMRADEEEAKEDDADGEVLRGMVLGAAERMGIAQYVQRQAQQGGPDGGVLFGQCVPGAAGVCVQVRR